MTLNRRQFLQVAGADIMAERGIIRPYQTHKFRVDIADHENLTAQVMSVDVNTPLIIIFRDDIQDTVRGALADKRNEIFDITVTLLDNDLPVRTYNFPDYKLASFKESVFSYGEEGPHTLTTIFRKVKRHANQEEETSQEETASGFKSQEENASTVS